MFAPHRPVADKEDCYVHEAAGSTKTIIFIHGLGDNGQGWLTQLNQATQGKVRIVTPNAPDVPVTLNGGHKSPSWFDMMGLSPTELLSDPSKGLQASKDRLNRIIERELKLLSSGKQLFIGGFSQGAALALHVSLGCSTELGGIAAFSGWPLKWDDLKVDPQNQKTPLLLHHGKSDNVIPFESSQELVKRLEALGVEPQKMVSDVAHSVPPQVMAQFVKMVLK